MIFKEGERWKERERQEWGRERGMHIQWSHDLLADKPSIAAERGHNEHSIEELTSHVKPLPVWLKGKKEGLYLLMIGPRTKLILFSTGRRTSLRRLFFLVVHEKENVNVWPDVWVEGYRGLSTRRSVSPRKVNIRYGDVFRHSGLRKHVSADTMHTNT